MRGAFQGSKKEIQLRSSRPTRSFDKRSLGVGGSKVRCALQAYICKDCGYIYRGPPSFESLPSSYKCPVCGVGKRRFVKYSEPTTKSRKRISAPDPKGQGIDSEDGSKLVVGAAFILLLCAALYVGLNSVY